MQRGQRVLGGVERARPEAQGARPDQPFDEVHLKGGRHFATRAHAPLRQRDLPGEDGLDPPLEDGHTEPHPFLGQLPTVDDQQQALLQAPCGVAPRAARAVGDRQRQTRGQGDRELHDASPSTAPPGTRAPLPRRQETTIHQPATCQATTTTARASRVTLL